MNLLSKRQLADETVYPFVVTFGNGVVRHFKAKCRDMLGMISVIQHNSDLPDAVNVQIESGNL